MRKKKHKPWYIIGLLVVLCLILADFVYILTFFPLMYSESFYDKEYTQNGVYMTQGGYEHVWFLTHELWNYFKTGEEVSSLDWSEQDKIHLVDVKNIIDALGLIGQIYLFLIIFLLLLLYVLNRNDFAYHFSQLLLWSGIIILGFTILAVLLAGEFSEVFYQFHVVTFDNDYWLMNPEKDLLINLYPQQFFYDFTAAWVGWSALVGLASVAGALLIRKYLH